MTGKQVGYTSGERKPNNRHVGSQLLICDQIAPRFDNTQMGEQRERLLFCFLCHSKMHVCAREYINKANSFFALSSLQGMRLGPMSAGRGSSLAPFRPADRNKKQSNTHELQGQISGFLIITCCGTVRMYTPRQFSIVVGHTVYTVYV